MKKSLNGQAIDVEMSTPDKLRERIRADIEKWRDIAAKAGVKAGIEPAALRSSSVLLKLRARACLFGLC